MFTKLDPLLHSQIRLAVMSTLVSVESASFPYLKEITESTAGNLSVQLSKLDKAEYISIEKGFEGKKPKTTCRITNTGREAFNQYIKALKTYF